MNIETRTGKRGKLQLMLLVFLVLFSPLGIDIYLPALPQIAESFHVEHTMAQDTITWFLFAMGVGQLFAGPLADRFGRKRIAVSGVIIYGAGAYFAQSAQGIEVLLAARILQGIGACATSVAAFATVRDIYGPDKSPRMISYLNGAICFIPALAPILGSYLTQVFGWRSNFTFMALFALIIGTLLTLLMRETNPETETKKVFSTERYKSILSNGHFLFYASLCTLAMAVILAYVTAAPIVLIDRLGLTLNQFTFWFGLNAAINIIAAFTAPRIMDTRGPQGALRIGLVAMVAGGATMVALNESQSVLTFMAPIFLSSVGFALVLGAAAGKALAPFGDRAGTAAALLGLFQMSGAGLLVGTTQRLGLEPAMNIALHMFLIAPALIPLTFKKGKIWLNIYNN